MTVKLSNLRSLTKLLIIVITFLLCGCNAKKEDSIQTLNETKNVVDVVSEIYYGDSMFEDINSKKYNLDELNKIYPIEFIKLRSNNSVYRVVYKTFDGYIMLYYDDNGVYSSGQNVYTRRQLEEFNAINIGNTLDDVMKFDENGNYAFLYAGRTDIDNVSFHYTIDGYALKIYYDLNGIVTDIEHELI